MFGKYVQPIDKHKLCVTQLSSADQTKLADLSHKSWFTVLSAVLR